MTVVLLEAFTDALPEPVRADARVTLTRWAGDRPVTVTDAESVTFPQQIDVPVTGGSVDVAPTDGRWCIRWTVEVPGAAPLRRFTSVPTLGPVSFGDLTDVDPATFLPSTDTVTAWAADVADAVATLNVGRAAVLDALDAGRAAVADALAAGQTTVADALDAGATAVTDTLDAGRAAIAAAAAAAIAGAADHADDAAQAADAAALARDAAADHAEDAAAARTGAEAALAGVLLGTENLDAVTRPGRYLQDVPERAAAALNYPVEWLRLVLEVAALPSGRVLQYAQAIADSGTTRRGVFRRIRTVQGVWTTWGFIPEHRVDQTAGRAMYAWDPLNNREQLIYGDTGWRNIAEMLVNGWAVGAGGAIGLRRVGSTVRLSLRNLDPAAATHNTFLAGIPNAFKPRTNNVRLPLAIRQGESATVMSSVVVRSYESDAQTPRAMGVIGDQYTAVDVMWDTIATWPSTLPGVALTGGIPNV